MIWKRWGQMNRVERIAWIVGAVAGLVFGITGYLVYCRMHLYFFPVFIVSLVMFFIAFAVESWRRKRSEAIMHIFTAIAIVITTICIFVF